MKKLTFDIQRFAKLEDFEPDSHIVIPAGDSLVINRGGQTTTLTALVDVGGTYTIGENCLYFSFDDLAKVKVTLTDGNQTVSINLELDGVISYYPTSGIFGLTGGNRSHGNSENSSATPNFKYLADISQSDIWERRFVFVKVNDDDILEVDSRDADEIRAQTCMVEEEPATFHQAMTSTVRYFQDEDSYRSHQRRNAELDRAERDALRREYDAQRL